MNRVRRTSGARLSEAGLTLIEMLIVLVIIGIASSAVMLGLRALGRDTAAEDEAIRLAAYLTLAVDEALVSRDPLSMVWTTSGYGFERWTGTEWQPAGTARLAKPHDLGPSVSLSRADGVADPLAISADGLGPSVALTFTGESPWHVAFDGLTGTAMSGATP